MQTFSKILGKCSIVSRGLIILSFAVLYMQLVETQFVFNSFIDYVLRRNHCANVTYKRYQYFLFLLTHTAVESNDLLFFLQHMQHFSCATHYL